jgi:hypothetical protein
MTKPLKKKQNKKKPAHSQSTFHYASLSTSVGLIVFGILLNTSLATFSGIILFYVWLYRFSKNIKWLRITFWILLALYIIIGMIYAIKLSNF